MRLLRLNWLLLSASALIFLLCISGLWIVFSPVVKGDTEESYDFHVERGATFQAILDKMQEEGVVESSFRVRLTGRILGFHDEMKAGRYEITGGSSSYELLSLLARGRSKSVRVTLPEGLQSREIAAILANKIGVDSTRFMRLVRDSTFARELGVPAPTLEGFLFPDTYNLTWGMKPQRVIRILVDEFHEQFDDSLRRAAQERGFSLLQVVTLASIIEGEAIVDSEREIISAVYHNRLKKGMRLQADPTIQFIIEDGPRRLLKKDLKIDSPYNTYRYSGLPPGPINNPGLASLIASFNPADVNHLYFVANGDGTHTFSRTLRQHLRAKARFDRHRREVEREQKATPQ